MIGTYIFDDADGGVKQIKGLFSRRGSMKKQS